MEFTQEVKLFSFLKCSVNVLFEENKDKLEQVPEEQVVNVHRLRLHQQLYLVALPMVKGSHVTISATSNSHILRWTVWICKLLRFTQFVYFFPV